MKAINLKCERDFMEGPIRFDVFKGKNFGNGEIIKIRSVGVGLLFPGFETYQLHLNALLKDLFFLMPAKEKSEFVLMTRKALQRGKRKFLWMRVGEGKVLNSDNGDVVLLTWDVFLANDIYMSLRPFSLGEPFSPRNTSLGCEEVTQPKDLSAA